MVVVASLKPTGLPTTQTMQAKAKARPRLKSGPAKATMIFCHGDAGGSSSRGVSVLPSIASMGAHLRQRDVTAGGDGTEDVFDAIDVLGPERLAEPDGELVDLEPAPLGRQEMAQLMDNDEDVEKEDDLQESDEREKEGTESVEVPVRNHEAKKKPEEPEEPEVAEG